MTRDSVSAILRQMENLRMHYIDRVCENPLSRQVKLVDVRDNLAPERAAGLTDAMRDRYERARVHLLLAGDAA